jgi:MATE family multidrug resistance protein
LPDAFAVTNRRVFTIAGPAMLANLTTPLLGIVATAAIGRLGEAALLGGVAMASLVFDSMFWLFGFLRMGTVALTAQALGAGDAGEQRAVLFRALLTTAAIGVALIVLQVPLAALSFGLMGGSATVTAAAKQYFFIRLWSGPFALGNYVMLGWLVGLARPVLALTTQVAINVINMALTILLVLGLGWGITGAAVSAVIAEIIGLVIGLAFAWHVLRGRFDLEGATLFDRDKLRRMLAINRDITIRTAALIAAFFFFTAQGALRRRDARRQCRAVQLHHVGRLLPRWFRQRRRTALRPRLWRARPGGVFPRGQARADLGLRIRRRRNFGVRLVRQPTDRSDDGEPTGARPGA